MVVAAVVFLRTRQAGSKVIMENQHPGVAERSGNEVNQGALPDQTRKHMLKRKRIRKMP